MKKKFNRLPVLLALFGALSFNTHAAVNFSTFVSTSDISTAENGQTNVIGFTYAGNEFVGSLYSGSNNDQLYSTNLNGGDVQKFGSPIPNGFSGEVVVGASLGQDGYAKGDIYAGAGSQIYQYANNGGTPSLFYTAPDGAVVRQVFFDPGNSFNGAMLVTTTAGDIYSVDGSGSGHLVASVHEDAEGMDIAGSSLGKYAGDLLVSSEGSGDIRAITPSGEVFNLMTSTGVLTIPEAETVSYVPLNLGASGNPIEGFYVANYPENIQYAAASNFTSSIGDVIVTSEYSGNSPLWDLHYNGDATGTFTVSSPIGNLPNQSEDGIFVTGQRIIDTNPVPEPSVMLMMLAGLAGLANRTRSHCAK